MVYQRVEGMKTMPSKQQAEALTTQLYKQPAKASREDFCKIIAKFDALLSKLLPKDMISAIQPQESNQITSITPANPPISRPTPEPLDYNQLSATTAAVEKIKPSSLSSLTPKPRKSKRLIPLKYSCDEIYERMENGLCIFCEERDTPGHHDLKHKGVEIIMIESDDQPIMTGSDDQPVVTESEPVVEESLVESDESPTETVMKLDPFSESLDCITSDLQIVDASGQKDDQNKSYAEDIVSISLGRKIEHMVGKQFQEADRVWEPGGLLTKLTSWNCLDKYRSYTGEIKPTRNLLTDGLEKFIQSAETKSCMVNEMMSFKVFSDLDLETWVRLAIYGCKHQKLMSLLDKEPRRVWERGGLTATCALTVVTPPFDISFDDMVIQEMRKSCVLIIVGSATMRWLQMIEMVCSKIIKLDVKSLLKNLEKFKSLEKAASDINSLLNVLEPIMPSSRRQLVAGLRQSTFSGTMIINKILHDLVHCRRLMTYGHTLENFHLLMLKQNLPHHVQEMVHEDRNLQKIEGFITSSIPQFLVSDACFCLGTLKEAEKVDKQKRSLIKFAGSVIIGAIDEPMNIATCSVSLGMGLNGDSHKPPVLIKGYRDRNIMK